MGEVISTVALADQISREFNVSDQGIDLEIEFTDDAHEATGAKLYLQLKSLKLRIFRQSGLPWKTKEVRLLGLDQIKW